MTPAQLSALVTALEELTARVSALAEEAAGGPVTGLPPSAGARTARGVSGPAGHHEIGGALFEVERSLQGALRRLAQLRI